MKIKSLHHKFCLAFLVGISVMTSASGMKLKEWPPMGQNEKWKSFFNFDVEAINALYTDQAILVTAEYGLKKGKDNLRSVYKQLKEDWKHIDTVYTHYIRRDTLSPSVYHEIGAFKVANGDVYNHLIVWNTKKDTLRELEVIYKNSPTPSVDSLLVDRRTSWVRQSNSQNIRSLLNDLYSKEAYYYWNSRDALYSGHQEIQEAFYYMANPDWSVEGLTPHYTKMINPFICFEIGTYFGPGGIGNYSLVWMMGEDDRWKIMLDTNF